MGGAGGVGVSELQSGESDPLHVRPGEGDASDEQLAVAIARRLSANLELRIHQAWGLGDRGHPPPNGPRENWDSDQPSRDSPGEPVRHSTRGQQRRSEEHTSELQSHHDLVCRLLLEKKKKKKKNTHNN